MTRSKIVDLIEKMYGHHYTPQTMSYITKLFTEDARRLTALSFMTVMLLFIWMQRIFR
ncbi:MAG TPA: hypothetical protein H9948_02550 [Candidatus Jeotgalibaca merdavium]|uniref:Uncharacterized protein n=1 Tax=Candidatus Jeotgalibaca merdavium TaxID=2838627 RepID=A0A9D2I0P7_9LACT|nr:hypothetical protein [Candidatus Jeotgalibaca merdavium]